MRTPYGAEVARKIPGYNIPKSHAKSGMTKAIDVSNGRKEIGQAGKGVVKNTIKPLMALKNAVVAGATASGNFASGSVPRGPVDSDGFGNSRLEQVAEEGNKESIKVVRGAGPSHPSINGARTNTDEDRIIAKDSRHGNACQSSGCQGDCKREGMEDVMSGITVLMEKVDGLRFNVEDAFIKLYRQFGLLALEHCDEAERRLSGQRPSSSQVTNARSGHAVPNGEVRRSTETSAGRGGHVSNSGAPLRRGNHRFRPYARGSQHRGGYEGNRGEAREHYRGAHEGNRGDGPRGSYEGAHGEVREVRRDRSRDGSRDRSRDRSRDHSRDRSRDGSHEHRSHDSKPGY